MLLELHSALQRLLYERGQISAREVDIQFERPTREQIDKLTRPTINLFLFDLQENTELRQNDFRTRLNDRRAERYLPPRYFDLRYMVSILTSAIEDEHLLLWRVLTTLVRHPQFPADLLPEELRAPDHFVTSKVSQDDDGERLSSLWNALGVPPIQHSPTFSRYRLIWIRSSKLLWSSPVPCAIQTYVRVERNLKRLQVQKHHL